MDKKVMEAIDIFEKNLEMFEREDRLNKIINELDKKNTIVKVVKPKFKI